MKNKRDVAGCVRERVRDRRWNRGWFCVGLKGGKEKENRRRKESPSSLREKLAILHLHEHFSVCFVPGGYVYLPWDVYTLAQTCTVQIRDETTGGCIKKAVEKCKLQRKEGITGAQLLRAADASVR